MDDETIISPNPILTALLLDEPEAGYLRSLFGLGLAEDPIEGVIVSPLAELGQRMRAAAGRVTDRFQLVNGLVSATPTGSINLQLRARLDDAR